MRLGRFLITLTIYAGFVRLSIKFMIMCVANEIVNNVNDYVGG